MPKKAAKSFNTHRSAALRGLEGMIKIRLDEILESDDLKIKESTKTQIQELNAFFAECAIRGRITDKNAPKRAAGAYEVFRSDVSIALKGEEDTPSRYPERLTPKTKTKNDKKIYMWGGKTHDNYLKYISALWNEATDEEKKPYVKQAEKNKAAYEIEKKKYMAKKAKESKNKKKGKKSDAESDAEESDGEKKEKKPKAKKATPKKDTKKEESEDSGSGSDEETGSATEEADTKE